MRMPGGVTVHEGGHTRSPGLLQLEEDHVMGAVALQQRNKRPQTHTANADHFMGHIYDPIRADHPVPMRRKGLQICLKPLYETLLLFGRNVRHDRGLVHDMARSVTLVCQFWK